VKLIAKLRNAHLRRQGVEIGRKSNISLWASFSTAYGGRITIGERAFIFPHVRIETYGGDITIGDDCSINPFCMIYGHGGLRIGHGVRIATHVAIVPANHIFADPARPIHRQGLSREGIEIGDDVWIGAGARILDGVWIAPGCVIGAGAVLTKSTCANGVYAGVPARRVSERVAQAALGQ
jgi:acetyltransferase-like isoleucine patch superfamily enzyme